MSDVGVCEEDTIRHIFLFGWRVLHLFINHIILETDIRRRIDDKNLLLFEVKNSQ